MPFERYAPSEDDVRFYEDHGWWASPWTLPKETVDDLLYGVERYYAGERDTPLPIELATDWTEARGNVLRQNDYISLQLNEFRNFLETSPIASVAGALARTDAIRLFHDQLLNKPPGVTGAAVSVGWHTDRAYWQTCSSLAMVSAWIALQDCTADMGPLVVLDASHTWPDLPEFRNFHTGDMTTLLERLSGKDFEIREVPLELKRGQVSFHHCKTMHGSYPNLSDVPRLAFTVHFQDHANVYRDVRDASSRRIIHINDILCRKDSEGHPDYSDPTVCPLLWSKS